MTAGGHGFDGVERRGLMFVLSSPSGAGKTTLSRLLIDRLPGLKMSVSATTRPMRPGEVDGRDYSFVDKLRFEALVNRNQSKRCWRRARTYCSIWTGRAPSNYGKKPVPMSSACSSCRRRLPTWRNG